MQAYGIDKELKFHRKTIVKQFSEITNHYNKFSLYSNHFSDPERNIEIALLGFCGKSYPIVIVTPTVNLKDLNTRIQIDKEKKVYYNYNEFCKDNGFTDNYLVGKRFYHSGHIDTNFHQIADLFKLHIPDFWETTDCPYFLLKKNYATGVESSYSFIENPILAEYKFNQIVSTEIAYQEIAQFLGQIKIRNKPEIKTLADKELIVKAGFDTKISFRKGKKNV